MMDRAERPRKPFENGSPSRETEQRAPTPSEAQAVGGEMLYLSKRSFHLNLSVLQFETARPRTPP